MVQRQLMSCAPGSVVERLEEWGDLNVFRLRFQKINKKEVR